MKLSHLLTIGYSVSPITPALLLFWGRGTQVPDGGLAEDRVGGTVLMHKNKPFFSAHAGARAWMAFKAQEAKLGPCRGLRRLSRLRLG